MSEAKSIQGAKLITKKLLDTCSRDTRSARNHPRFLCDNILLQEDQNVHTAGRAKRKGNTRTNGSRKTDTPLFCSVMERNGQRPHKRLIAKASGVWVRQGCRGAAEWGVGLGGATRSEEVDRGGHVPSAEGPRSGRRCIASGERVWSGGGRERLGLLLDNDHFITRTLRVVLLAKSILERRSI